MDPTMDMSPPDSEGLAELPDEDVGPKRMEDALRSITASWLSKLKQAEKHKKMFAADAKEAMNFFDGAGDWFWSEKNSPDQGNAKVAPPSFRMVVNKVFEAVKLFGSVIYARNPVRTVTPKAFPVIPPSSLGIDLSQPPEMDPMTGEPVPDPRIQAFMKASRQVGLLEEDRRTVASLVEHYLNYTPVELNLKENSRQVVDEAIIKGMGCWWTELVEMPSDDGEGYGMIGSFHDTVDHLLMDPDADKQEDLLWIAKRCIHPVDEVSARYGLEREKLKGHLESNDSQSQSGDSGYQSKKRAGKTNDLISYWKIYSKTGFGHTLKGAPKEFREMFDSLGQNCYIVVAEGVDFPLNVSKEVAMAPPGEDGVPQEVFTQTRWPIPFYADINGWPCTFLQFHRKPNNIWPISHLKPGMAELKFINWAMSFLATRVMTSCNTVVGVAKAAGDDIKASLLKSQENGFSFLEISETLGRPLNDLVHVFTLPELSPEIWKILQEVTVQLEKRLGLTELVYGMTRSQFRSAAEAQVKSEQISVRPDDMANVLEDAMTELSRKEAMAAKWLLQGKDLKNVFGPLGLIVWEQKVKSLKLNEVAREFDYRIEAGSARKPNKASKVEQMQMAIQTLGPVLQQVAGAGQVEPLNALLSDWCKSLDIEPGPYMIQPPPPAPPQLPPADTPPGSGGPQGEPGGGGPLPPQDQGPPPEEPPPEGSPPAVQPDQIPMELQP